MNRKKPRLLIIGHARHGKDTVAEMIRDKMGLKFQSSSVFVGQECIWDSWGKERYETFDEMFKDRVNYRSVWANLISAYNTPDKTRTARTMFERGNDMYVGMRMRDEVDACINAELFDHIIWVDRSNLLDPEPISSNELRTEDADYFLANFGTLEMLEEEISNLQKHLHRLGFDVNYKEPLPEGWPIPKEPLPEGWPIPVVYTKSATEFEAEEMGRPDLEDRLKWIDAPEGATSVLDHGFFQIKEVMGSDDSIADSARMSYGRGTKKVNNNQGLINYLVRNHHTSPLEMGEIKFHMRLPIFVMRQLVRHRTASLNEYSGRYSEMVRLFYVPENTQICAQDTVNKQGSAEPLSTEEAEEARFIIESSSNASFNNYEKLLEKNVSRETARMVLPLNTYTEVVWKLDVSNLIKFLWLRDDSHAQWEIQVYAKLISDAVEEHFPMVFEAYKKARASVTLTEDQIYALINGDTSDLSKSETAQVVDLVNTHHCMLT